MPSGVWPASARPSSAPTSGWRTHLDVVLARGETVRLHQAARGVVGEDDAALGVHHDHAFEHAGQDGFHARAVLGELRHPPAQFAGRVVEHPRDGAEFVAARVSGPAPRSRRTAYRRATAAIAFTRRASSSDESHARPRAAHERHRQRHQQAAADRPELIVDVGEGQREPDDGHVRVRDGDGDVEQVGAERRAVPALDAHARRGGPRRPRGAWRGCRASSARPGLRSSRRPHGRPVR